MAICAPQTQLEQRARALGNNADIIMSYKRVQGTPDGQVPRSQNWFFSKNDTLAGVSKKPSALPGTWDEWDGLRFQQRIVLGNLGGFDANTVVHNDANLVKIANAYTSWPDGLVAVFWGSGLPDGGELNPVNTCNIFVGEALWSDGKSTMIGSKYASALQIYDARFATSPLRWRMERVSVAEAQPGDIAAWYFEGSGSHHVEIISSLDVDAGTFCTIGGYRSDMGTENCAGDSRRLALASGESPSLLIYRWCPQESPQEEAHKRGCGCLRWFS